jgi:hypothetical protein
MGCQFTSFPAAFDTGTNARAKGPQRAKKEKLGTLEPQAWWKEKQTCIREFLVLQVCVCKSRGKLYQDQLVWQSIQLYICRFVVGFAIENPVAAVARGRFYTLIVADFPVQRAYVRCY